VRCRACGTTQALLPWFVVPWRWDVVEVIGQALELLAKGWGYRRTAAAVGRPEMTVRGWGRRFRRGAVAMAQELLARAVSWGWSGWELPITPLSRCLAAVEALADQWQRRRAQVDAWRVANLITGGRLLVGNMAPPLAPATAWSWMSAKSKQEVPSGP
jgi:hypothetical protein